MTEDAFERRVGLPWRIVLVTAIFASIEAYLWITMLWDIQW